MSDQPKSAPRQAVLFLIDTQGTNCVGCYAGRPELGTPNIDRLAAAGMRFDRAHCAAPVCGPARSAIFTGLYPHSNGVLGNDMAPARDVPTLGERLAQAGIPAGYIGKWHLDGSDYFGDGRCAPGWDPRYWFDGRNYLESLPDDAARALSRQVLDAEAVARHGVTAEFTHAHRTADKARAFIAEHRDRDFFLVVSIDEPHHPYICPEPFVSAFEDFEHRIGPSSADDLADKPRSQREWRDYQQTLRESKVTTNAEGEAVLRDPRYFACNSYSDHEVGRVIAAIDEQVPDALVIYTADHGNMFFAHGINGKGPAMYDEITRVPLIVRRPGDVAAGGVAASPASHVDLVPTVLEFFGIDRPDLLQGTSLWPRLTGGGISGEAKPIFMEFNRFEVDHDGFGSFTPIRCVTDGRYKLAINLMDTDELYDLVEDPAEVCNRIDDPALAAVRDRMHDLILAWMGETRDPLRCPQWGRRPWRDLGGSTWGGTTRPRRFDPEFFPHTLLYDTAETIDRFTYDKV